MIVGFKCNECKKTFDIDHDDALVAFCTHCGMINRLSQSDNSDFKFGAPEEDYSPIQIGTTGKFEGKQFQVAGRLRFDFRNAFRNFWSVVVEDGRRLWLIESYGYYVIAKNESLQIPANLFRSVKAGKIISFEEKEWPVETVYENQNYKGEGELFETIPSPFTHEQVEMSNESGEGIFISILSPSNLVFYRGKYFEFDEMNFKTFRTSAAWI